MLSQKSLRQRLPRRHAIILCVSEHSISRAVKDRYITGADDDGAFTTLDWIRLLIDLIVLRLNNSFPSRVNTTAAARCQPL